MMAVDVFIRHDEDSGYIYYTTVYATSLEDARDIIESMDIIPDYYEDICGDD